MDIHKYRSTCVHFFEFMKRGRGGMYLGGNTLLGSNVLGQKILTDARHAPSIKSFFVSEPVDSSIMALLYHLIKGGMVCAEIDAGCGYHSVFLASLVGPSGKVYSFEPIPECFELLVKNTQLNELNSLEYSDLWIVNGMKKLKKTYFDINYQFFFFPANANYTRHLDLETIALDSYMRDKNEQEIDFIKINGESLLPLVWEGMQETILQSPDIKILCRINPEEFSRQGHNLGDFYDQIKLQQFGVYQLPTLRSLDKKQLLEKNTPQTILLSRESFEK